MADSIVTGYTYSVVSKQIIITQTEFLNVAIEEIKSIYNASTGTWLYNPEIGKHGVKRSGWNTYYPLSSVSGGTIVYTAPTPKTATDNDTLVIIVNNRTAPISVSVTNTGNLSPTAAPLITSSLVFAAGDVLTTEKTTAALTLSSLSSSGNYVISVTKPTDDTAGDLTLKIYNQVKTNGIDSTDQYLTTLVIEKIAGSATNRSFIVSGLGVGNGTIKIGGYFEADSGAITVNITIHAIHTEDISIPTTALASGSLSFAIGEGLTEKVTTAIPMYALSPSGNYILSVTKPSEDTAGDLTLKVYNQVKTDGTNSTDQLVTIRTVEKITGSATNRCYMLYGIGIGEGTIKIGGSFAANCAAATTVNFVINAI